MAVLFKYLSTITEVELDNDVVIPCTDEDGFHCILIKNSKRKTLNGAYSTDNLDIKINRVLSRNGNDYYVHIIKAKKNDGYSNSQFNTIFEYVFSKIENEIDDIQLSGLITSLEDYFKTTQNPNRRETQIGVFGELLAIKYLAGCGYSEIVNKYHTNFYSKHDIEINSGLRMEIKATTSEKRIHHFKHNQIMRSDVEVLIVSILLEEAKEGVSLRELFNMVMPLFHDADSIFALKKLMIRCGLDEEDCGMSFSFEKAMQNIRFYSASKLPKINKENFDGITNIEYDVDCSNCEFCNVEDVLSLLKVGN